MRMRPAISADRDRIAALIRARGRWLVDRGMPGQGWIDHAGELAAQAEQDSPVWVLARGEDVLGCTSLYEQAPTWAWPQQEPCFYLATTVTDPAYAGTRLGCRMVWWVLDHAARRGRDWVRRSTIERGLAAYYSDVQGWKVCDEQVRKGVRVWLLERPAERRSDLDALMDETVLPG